MSHSTCNQDIAPRQPRRPVVLFSILVFGSAGVKSGVQGFFAEDLNAVNARKLVSYASAERTSASKSRHASLRVVHPKSTCSSAKSAIADTSPSGQKLSRTTNGAAATSDGTSMHRSPAIASDYRTVDPLLDGSETSCFTGHGSRCRLLVRADHFGLRSILYPNLYRGREGWLPNVLTKSPIDST